MVETIDITKKRRSVTRRSTTKLVNKVHDQKGADDAIDARILQRTLDQLNGKRVELKDLDKKIFEYMLENDEEEDCDKEAEDAAEYEDKIMEAIDLVTDELAKYGQKSENGEEPSEREDAEEENATVVGSQMGSVSRSGSRESLCSGASNISNPVTGRKVRVKLPQLELKKFSGKIHEWEEFWDGFLSAVHENEELANVDKLKYLRAFLEEPARSVLAGLRMTDADYLTGVELLKKRYAKPSVIQHEHINQLIHLSPVFSEDNVTRLRTFRDQIETHYRGLEALAVDKTTYSGIVVPILMEKLPKQIRFNMVRAVGKSFLKWSLEEMISALDVELEIRECHSSLFKPGAVGASQESRRPKQEVSKIGCSTASALFTQGKPQKRCVFCEEDHLPEDCTTQKDPEERKTVLKKHFKCFVCLKQGHRSFECRSKVRCKFCNAKHHPCICTTNRPIKEAPPNKEAPLSPSAPAWVGSTCSGSEVALQTALAKVDDKNERNVRVLFDSGSHRSFVTARAVETFGLRPVRKENLAIKAFGSQETEKRERDVVEFSLCSLKGGNRVQIQCFVVDDIARISNIHVGQIRQHYPHLHMIYFSDFPRHDEDKLQIDILIGSDFLWQFLEGETIRGGPQEPVAVRTTLGWVLSGPLRGEKLNCSESSVNFIPVEKEEKKVDAQLNKLWDLDSLGIRPEDEVQESFVDNIVFTGSRYSVSLPWKAGHGPVPLNYNNCLGRLKNQIRKFNQDPDIFRKYHDIISEQVDLGIVSQVAEMDQAEKVSYLPHSAVIRKDAETTKVRVVYDASCRDKVTGTSLNSCLHVGPSLSPLIFDILLRFRNERVALVGDIAKAFLNIEVDPADRDCLRFLWLKDIEAKEPEIITLRFNRVIFGVNSSPFLLNAVLRHHLCTFQEIDPNFVFQLSQSFYVDDLVTGSANTEEAYTLYSKAKERMLEGGFQLRKWKTNDRVLREKICEKERESEAEKSAMSDKEESFAKEALGPIQESGGKTKVLGMIWDNEQDKLEFDLMKMGTNTHSDAPTKRGILSTLAAIFDPLGLTSPIGVLAKVLFQELCIQQIDWDDPIPEDKAAKWKTWVQELRNVNSISVARCIFDPDEGQIQSCQLHGFGDASKKAYCAVVYLVYKTTKGTFTKLLCSKTRVAPLKELSIPRLELMSARILAVLMDNVYKAIGSQIMIEKMKFWLDSKTALYWIYNHGEWKQWVQFRVAEILRLSKKEDWGHVSGLDNPADIGSRGATASELKSSKLWWEGPEWLRKDESEWPKKFVLEDSVEVKTERKKAFVFTVVTDEAAKIGNVIDIERFSSLGKLLRVTAWVKRFITNLKQKREKRELRRGGLEAREIETAERVWILDAQMMLQNTREFEKTKLQLGIVEKDKVLVCQGRLENSDLEFESRYPIILPKEHRLTYLIVLDCHKKVHHSKVRSTLAEVRSRFWVTKGRQFVKKILKLCFLCRKLNGKSYNAPRTAALPGFRVSEAPPFSSTGVDFAGPLMVKTKSGEMIKTYIALFSCCITRAIHLELVTDLSTGTFINCLRRFCARRGTPGLMVSDNAKTFKHTSRVLHKLLLESAVGDFLSAKRIMWQFNLERTPWWGGHFERMVGTTKSCLKKVLGNARLSLDELTTVLTEVESTINSRPLTYFHEEFDEQVLTPSHLLVGRRISPLSENVDANLDLDEYANNNCLSKRFVYLTKKLTHFWNRWHREYLSGLREVHRIHNGVPNRIAKGDIVLIQEENAKRNDWKLGIVEKLISGKDGQVRGAQVRKATTRGKPEILNRPLQKLFPLETERKLDVEEKGGEESQAEKEDLKDGRKKKDNPRGERPRRVAAQNARIKTHLMLDP